MASPLVWIDMEMTGLDPESCTILEMASVVTTSELEVLGHGPEIVIHHGEAVLEAMTPWCKEHHGKSGLTEAVRRSTVSLTEAEQATLAFVREHTAPKESPLCGNSVDLDRRFIVRHMPALAQHLQPAIIDVTTIKELGTRWRPSLQPPLKRDTHRALTDILESIDELRYYRNELFRSAS
jgi:oligoribonuclease